MDPSFARDRHWKVALGVEAEAEAEAETGAVDSVVVEGPSHQSSPSLQLHQARHLPRQHKRAMQLALEVYPEA